MDISDYIIIQKKLETQVNVKVQGTVESPEQDMGVSSKQRMEIVQNHKREVLQNFNAGMSTEEKSIHKEKSREHNLVLLMFIF